MTILTIPAPLSSSAGTVESGPSFAARRPSRKMLDRLTRYRFAVAAFQTPQRFWSVLDDLVAGGFTGADLCVLSSRSALDLIERSLDSNMLESCKLLHLFKTLGTLQTAESVTNLQAADAHAMIECPQAKHSVDLDAIGRELFPRYLQYFETEIKEGAIVLLVSSRNNEQHRRASRILLKHSSSRIRVCEFTRAS